MKIGKKLFGFFAIMIVLVVIVGGVGYYSLNQTKFYWESAENGGITISDIGDGIVIDILQCRRAEKDFLLRYSSMGISAAKDEYIVNKIDKIVPEIDIKINKIISVETEFNDNEAVKKLKAFQQQLKDYYSGIKKLVDMVTLRGHEDEGLVGDLRKSVHSIERA